MQLNSDIQQNQPIMSLSYKRKGKIPFWFAWLLAILLLVSSGIVYRVLASMVSNTVISLPLDLDEFPFEIGDWIGQEVQIPTTTREYMEKNFADDYLSRRYFNIDNQEWVDLYVVYCASIPGGLLGHRPEVCYPGNGWIHDSTEKSNFTTKQGREVECLILRFHKPAPAYKETIVLNFHIVNGKLTTDQSSFQGFSGRRFNLSKNPARYVAQVQISSIMEKSVLVAAKDIVELILDYLPDENGKVAAYDAIKQK